MPVWITPCSATFTLAIEDKVALDNKNVIAKAEDTVTCIWILAILIITFSRLFKCN